MYRKPAAKTQWSATQTLYIHKSSPRGLQIQNRIYEVQFECVHISLVFVYMFTVDYKNLSRHLMHTNVSKNIKPYYKAIYNTPLPSHNIISLHPKCIHCVLGWTGYSSAQLSTEQHSKVNVHVVFIIIILPPRERERERESMLLLLHAFFHSRSSPASSLPLVRSFFRLFV